MPRGSPARSSRRGGCSAASPSSSAPPTTSSTQSWWPRSARCRWLAGTRTPSSRLWPSSRLKSRRSKTCCHSRQSGCVSATACLRQPCPPRATTPGVEGRRRPIHGRSRPTLVRSYCPSDTSGAPLALLSTASRRGCTPAGPTCSTPWRRRRIPGPTSRWRRRWASWRDAARWRRRRPARESGTPSRRRISCSWPWTRWWRERATSSTRRIRTFRGRCASPAPTHSPPTRSSPCAPPPRPPPRTATVPAGSRPKRPAQHPPRSRCARSGWSSPFRRRPRRSRRCCAWRTTARAATDESTPSPSCRRSAT
mmetsp:Transcript_20778/g.67265  ORF Transcript_20778/g.67265 Transcript_20778/m.67265 type:complete len:309 (-) Transcript_20778:1800-2726(-)